MATFSHIGCLYKIYPDGLGCKGGIGASAILYKGDNIINSLRYYLRTDKQHMVYEAERVGISMGLHLLIGLNRKLNDMVIMGSDSQALIKAIKNQRPHTGHYILDEIHNAAEKLQAKQDRLFNRGEQAQAAREGVTWKGRAKGVIDLRLIWVPGHHDFTPNKCTNEEAKKAAQGDSSDAKLLLLYLRKSLPHSITALHQDFTARLNKHWSRCWKTSPCTKVLCVEVFTSNTCPLYILFVLLSTLPLIATRTLFCYLTYLAYDDPARLIFVPELL